ncbi:MAG: tetratricopeptide repeat protein [Planctomycetaceae bacterium]|nr:tetratricopeptide repeat protein [Planctomycetaceae bacterium]
MRASEIDAGLHGVNSVILASDLSLLAMIHEKSGHFAEAETYYSRSLDMRRKTLGDRHPETARTMYQMGCFYKNFCRHDQSEPCFRGVYATLAKNDRDDSEIYLDVLKQLTETSITNGNLTELEKFLKESLEAHIRILGLDRERVILTLPVFPSVRFQWS